MKKQSIIREVSLNPCVIKQPAGGGVEQQDTRAQTEKKINAKLSL